MVTRLGTDIIRTHMIQRNKRFSGMAFRGGATYMLNKRMYAGLN